MTALLQGYKKVLSFGLLIIGLLFLVACDSDGNIIIKPPVEPADFKVSTSFSADEPKLIVQVNDLVTENLEKLEYKLERFSNQCNDSDKVYTGEVPNPAKSMSFDIATEAYGAYKLSVSATYGSALFQNPVKTILPAAPSLDDLPTNTDLSGLVFINIFDNQLPNIAQQIHFPDGDGNIELGIFNFSAQIENLSFQDSLGGNSGLHIVESTINAIGTGDRKWCSSDGIDMVAKNAKGLLLTGEGDTLAFQNPEGRQQITQNSEVDPIVLRLVIEPDTVAGNRAPYIFFNLVIHKLERLAGGGFERGAEVYNEIHLVQDCATKKSELSELDFDLGDSNNLCFEFNDFPN